MHLRKGNPYLHISGSSNKGNSDRCLGIGVDLGNDNYLLISVRHMLKKLLLSVIAVLSVTVFQARFYIMQIKWQSLLTFQKRS